MHYLKKSEMKYLLTEVNFFILSLLIILSVISIIKSDNAQCSKKQTCEESAEKYKIDLNNPKWEQIKENIETAFVEYTPCNNTNCKCHVSVIKNDLKQFKDGITKDMIKLANKLGTKYQIINHQLYRDKECMFPSRCSGIEHFLLKLAPKLPNIEFIVNTRDWPQILKYNKPLPVFSFSKTSDYFDIIYPAWSFWEGGPAISLYPTGIGRWDEHRKKLAKISKEISWEDKIPKAFFRGSRTSPERDPLVLLSREFPDLVDAQYTKNQAWKSSADTLNAEPAKEVPFEDHCKYRYLFNFRGVAASFRLKHLFLCKSLVFHVGDEWIEFFYPAMKPWIHYIPVKNKASKEELRNLIHFVIHNDKLIRKIAEHGYEFIWNNLKMNDVICYWNRLLQHYAKLLKYEPVLDDSLVRIYNK